MPAPALSGCGGAGVCGAAAWPRRMGRPLNERVVVLVAGLAGAAILLLALGLGSVAQVAAMGILGTFAVLAFGNARLAFLFLFLTRPVIDMFWGQRFIFGVNPLYVVGGLVPIFVLLYLLRRSWGVTSIRGSGAVLAFLVSGLASLVLWLVNTPQSLEQSFITTLKVVSAHCVFFVMARVFYRRDAIQQFTTVVLLSAASAYAFTVFQYLSGGATTLADTDADSAFYLDSREGFQRISGVYEGTYELAYYSVYVLFFGAFTWSRLKKPLMKVALAAYMLVAAYVLFRTYVRVAWAMLAFAPFAVAALQRRRTAGVLAAVVTAAIFFGVADVRARFGDELGFVRGDVEFARIGASRGTVWENYWGNFMKGTPAEILLGRRGLGNPENQILFLLGYYGIVGTVLYHLMMVYLSYLQYRSFRYFQMKDDRNRERFALLSFVLFVAFLLFGGIGTQQLTIVSSQWILFAMASISIWQWQQHSTLAATGAKRRLSLGRLAGTRSQTKRRAGGAT
jgi:O-antigen ligase